MAFNKTMKSEGRDGGGRDRDRDGRDGGSRDGGRDRDRDGKDKPEPYFEFKDPASLTRFLMEGGKIVPARISKLSLKHQKQLNQAIKRARNLALLPLGSLAFDYHNRVEMISPVPFEL